jgi:hypothetical protein
MATVTTADATSITTTSATLGGSVTSDGGVSVTERGICYSITQNPTTASSKTVIGIGVGTFSNTVSGLSANSTYYVRAYAINSQGTAYGTQVNFTTGAIMLATLTTTTPSNVGAISAVLGGNVTSDGGASVTERGICYGTVQNPTTANSKLAIGVGVGTYSNTVTGLTSSTTYYARAYAINSQGSAYGAQVSFTTAALLMATLTTTDATSIGSTGATLGGNVTNDGNSTVTERGICYSTSSGPTTANTKLIIGNGTGIFSNAVSGLTQNTTYYVKAYAINGLGIAYGNEVSFKTTIAILVASLTTNSATSITNSSAVLGGNISDDGNATVTDRGICYATTQNPTTTSNKLSIGNGKGAFSNTITGLTANTTYYVRAYAVNSQGIAYGNQISFATLGSLPTLTTKDVTNILETTAVTGGTVLTDDGASVTERGICYGTTTNPTIYDNKIAGGSGLGSFNVPLNTLIPNITYYTRAYATNKNGTAYGENKTFKTADAYYAGFENGIPVGWTGNWTISSDSPYEGYYCMKSVTNGDYIQVTLNITNPTGGQISFYHNGESGNNGVGFYIDNEIKATLTEYSWTLHAYPINTGIHTIKWINNCGTYYHTTHYIDFIICPK